MGKEVVEERREAGRGIFSWLWQELLTWAN